MCDSGCTARGSHSKTKDENADHTREVNILSYEPLPCVQSVTLRFIKLAEKHDIAKKGEIKLKNPKHLQVHITNESLI